MLTILTFFQAYMAVLTYATLEQRCGCTLYNSIGQNVQLVKVNMKSITFS